MREERPNPNDDELAGSIVKGSVYLIAAVGAFEAVQSEVGAAVLIGGGIGYAAVRGACYLVDRRGRDNDN